MDRRSFLRGTFGGVAAGGILIAAADTDLAAFAASTQVGTPVEAAGPPEGIQAPLIGHVVFNSDHQPFGVISKVNYHRYPVDATRAGDVFNILLSGTVEFTVVVQGFANVATLLGQAHQRTK